MKPLRICLKELFYTICGIRSLIKCSRKDFKLILLSKTILIHFFLNFKFMIIKAHPHKFWS